jgi:hypothetical protein
MIMAERAEQDIIFRKKKIAQKQSCRKIAQSHSRESATPPPPHKLSNSDVRKVTNFDFFLCKK